VKPWNQIVALAFGCAFSVLACDEAKERPMPPEAQSGSASSSVDAGVSGAMLGTGGTEPTPSGGTGGAELKPPLEPENCSAPEPVVECDEGWCRIPSGCFVMGSPEREWGRAPYEEVETAVTLTRSFEIQQTEVTREAWSAEGLPVPAQVFDDGTGDCTDDPRCPVAHVTWFEALAFANLLSERRDPPLEPCYELIDCVNPLGEGLDCRTALLTSDSAYDCLGYRLPTDAEWEYAARAGSSSAFCSGDIKPREGGLNALFVCVEEPDLLDLAFYCWNSEGMTHPVAQKQANAFGLFDVLGNVSEWTNDPSDGLPPDGATDPGGQIGEGTTSRNTRGGAYHSWPSDCRLGRQNEATWGYRAADLGLRLVRTVGK
jgi:formylglycine-generating enzyme required for sulfatase activity